MNLSYNTDPFPHISGSLDEDFYEEVEKSWNSVVHKEYSIPAGNRSNIALEDKDLRYKFKNYLREANERFINDFMYHYPKLVNSHDIELDNRILYSENNVSDKPYKIRGLHLDSGDKFLVGLWYFRHPEETGENGGDLVLFNPLTKESKTIKYGRNVFVIFPNLPISWHMVTPRGACKYPRRYINLLLESSNTVLHNYKRAGNSVDAEFRGKLVNYYK